MSDGTRFESEKFFVETMVRILRNRSEYKVLYINISKLKPKNRHPRFIRVVARMFDNLVVIAEGTMFVFTNGDIALLGKKITAELVDGAVKKLRSGLVTDPIWTDDKANEFARLYNPEEFENLLGKVNDLMVSGEDSMPPDKLEVDAGQIEAVKNHLDSISMVDLIKHQNVLKLMGGGKFEVVFDEFFVAVKDLSGQFDKRVDLTANKWLFLYLTQTLDKKTMASFAYSEIKNKTDKVSINLNLSTVFSPEFEEFAKIIQQNNQEIIVEVQAMDILSKPVTYFDAKEFLHRMGGKILLDAVSIEMLRALNVTALQPDYIKIFWHPLMEEFVTDADKIKEIIATLGTEKFILAKVQDEKAVRWGLNNSIKMFQGPYIDNLEVAVIRRKCPQGKVCTQQDCLKRKRLVAGGFRSQCSNIDILESGSRI